MKRSASLGAVVVSSMVLACDTGGRVGIPSEPGRADWLPWVEDVPFPDVPLPEDSLESQDADPVGDLAGGDEGEADPDQGPRDAILPDEWLPARSMRFRMAGREGEDLRIEVVARDFTGVFGIALRIEWDPDRAALVSALPGPVLDGAGETTALAAEIRPGSLAVGVALTTYTDAADWTGDRVVATFTLRPKGRGPIPLSFWTARSMVFDSRLGRQEVSWIPAVAHP